MSWWVHLQIDGEDVEITPHEEGGTYCLGGSDTAELNVTWNYGGRFIEAWGEELPASGSLPAMLNGRTAEETAPLLEAAVAKLGTERDPDYWKPTPGNAGAALALLASWARQYPKGVWVVH